MFHIFNHQHGMTVLRKIKEFIKDLLLPNHQYYMKKIGISCFKGDE